MAKNNIKIWNVEDGMLQEVRKGDKVFHLNDPIDYNAMLSKLDEEQIEQYLELHLTLIAPTPTPPQVQKKQVQTKKMEPTQKVDDDQEQESEPEEENDDVEKKWERPVPEESYSVPSHYYGGYHVNWMPKKAVQILFKQLETNGKVTNRSLLDDPEWKWQPDVGGVLVRVLKDRGILTMNGASRWTYYTIGNPTLALKEYLIKKGVEITPESVEAAIWTPIDEIRKFLNDLTERGYLKKHPSKNEYAIANMPKVGVPTPVREIERPVVQEQVTPGIPTKGWTTFKGEFYKCLFGHGGTKIGWRHGQLRICDECYKKKMMAV